MAEKLVPYSPLLSAQLPGGSQILDRNLLAIKKSLDAATGTINRLTTIININVSGDTGQPFAPIDAKYILQQPSAPLTNAQALSLLPTGLLKNTTGTGVLSTAVVGVDLFYQTVSDPIAGTLTQRPILRAGSGMTAVDDAGNTRTVLNIDLSTGIAGGQSVIGGTAAGNALTLRSTTNATRGLINVGLAGNVWFDEALNELALNASADFAHFNVTGANFEGVFESWSANVFIVHSEAGGTGTVRAIKLSSTAGLTFDTYVQINGATAAANSALTVGHATNSDRDHVSFFVGGGTQGATGTNDNTLADVVPSNTTVRAGVTGGIYSTQRIHSLTYSSAAATSPAKLVSLYIDDAPTAGANISGTTFSYALYVASGDVQFGGNAGVTGNLQVTGQASAHSLIVTGSGGTILEANGDTTLLGFFGVTAVARQTGGAATAGATYTATEQGMINRMYSALRTYGLLT